MLAAFVSSGSSYIATASSGGLFEESGPPMTTGTVPEPFSVLLLATAALGAAAIGRRDHSH